MRQSRQSRVALCLGLVCLPYIWLSTRLWFVCDDAYISFRYARNFANGHGLRYNLGDHTPIEGYSNLLWVLIASIFEYLEASTPTAMSALSWLCGLSLVVYFFWAVQKYWTNALVPTTITTLLLSTSAAFCMWGTGGLATMPLALVTFATFERLVLSQNARAWRMGALAGILLTLIRTEGICWALVITTLAFGVHQAKPRATRPPIGKVVALLFGTLGLLLLWRYTTYGALVANTASTKVSHGIDFWIRGAKYVFSYWLVLVTPALCLLVAAPTIKRHGRVGLAVFLMALAYPCYSVAVGGDFMPMGRFLLPGLPFAAMLMGTVIDTAWSKGPIIRSYALVLATFCIAVQLLPGVGSEENSQTGPLTNDVGIHLVPRSIREDSQFRFKKFYSDLKLWGSMRARAKRWEDWGLMMRRAVSADASVVRGPIGAFGYYSDLFLYDKFGLVSAPIDIDQSHENFQKFIKSTDAPGHDQYTPDWAFLPKEPTIIAHNFIDDDDQVAEILKTLRIWVKWSLKNKVSPLYAPRLHVEPGDTPESPPFILLLLEKEPDPQKSVAKWNTIEHKLMKLNYELSGLPWNPTSWEGYPRPEPSEPAPAGSHPNVLILHWNGTRADHLSAYGYHRETSPWLNRFAEESLLFERTISPAIWAVPSRASLFTGLPPTGHGITPNNMGKLDSRLVTMAECMGASGFDTYLFSADNTIRKRNDLGRGFKTNDHPRLKRWAETAKRIAQQKLMPKDKSTVFSQGEKKLAAMKGNVKVGIKDVGPLATKAFTKWLDHRDSDAPWLAFISFVEPLVPRMPSRKSRKALFTRKQIKQQMATEQFRRDQLLYNFGYHDFTSEDLEVINQVYDASLRDVDAASHLLVNSLAKRGVLDDTIVVITSDHGEMLGEHHRLGNIQGLYSPLVHVPLVIRYPKRLAPGRVQQAVSMLGLYPTLLDLSETAPCTDDLQPSLLATPTEPTPVFSEVLNPKRTRWKRMLRRDPSFDPTPWNSRYRSAEFGDFRLIRTSSGTTQLYDLRSEASERTDVSAEHPAVVTDLSTQLDQWLTSFRHFQPPKDEQP